MHLVELTEYLIKSLVKDPEMVSVKKFDDDEETITIQVLVDNDDMGAVIGKGGLMLLELLFKLLLISTKTNE